MLLETIHQPGRPPRPGPAGARRAGRRDPRLHRRRPWPRTAGTSAPTSARSSSRWPCTGSSTRPATPSSGTPATRPTSTRSSPAARPASSSCARPAGCPATRRREESEHDFVENSHASTILSYAYGLAVARDSGADPDRRHIVAVIGDGSMTGGMAYEALNNLGHSDRNVIIVLNDNGRSYAPTVSKLSEEPHARSASTRSTCAASGGSRRSCATCRSSARRPRRAWRPSRPRSASTSSRRRSSSRSACATSARSTATTSPRSSVALRNATEFDGPIVVHVLTQKGRGYPPAEDDDEKHLHDAPCSTRPSVRRRRCRPATRRPSPRR